MAEIAAIQKGVQGDTSITYDDAIGMVTAYGETSSDLDTDFANQVSFSVKDQNGTTVATANDYRPVFFRDRLCTPAIDGAYAG